MEENGAINLGAVSIFRTNFWCNPPHSIVSSRLEAREMASEQSPLLKTRDCAAHEMIYYRFTPAQKRWIVCVVSLAGLLPSKQSPKKDIVHCRNTMLTEKKTLPAFVSATFVPSIPQIAKDLNSTYAVVR